MKAVLEFTLPEDIIEFHNAVDAGKAFSLLHWIESEIRDRLKYGKGDTPDDEFILAIRTEIRGEFDDFDER